MQKRITALNPGLIAGATLSILLHAGAFHVGLFNMRASEKPADVIMDSGTIAVELTLMPAIASVPTPPEPMPEPEPTPEPEPEPEIEPEPEKTTEPVIPLPLPVADAPSPIQPQETKQQAPPEPEEESEQDRPESSIESIDQDGAPEEDKGVITDAVVQNSYKVTYPPSSRRRGEKGSVTLLFDISNTGKTSNIQVVTSSGYKRLDKAAIKAIAGARFNPAQQFGKPVASTLTETIDFRLTND